MQAFHIFLLPSVLLSRSNFATHIVSGHANRLIFAEFDDGVRVAIMLGRLHYYEGHDMSVVAIPARILTALGIKHLIVSSASGGLDHDIPIGSFVVLRDHLSFPSLAGTSPLRGNNDDRLGPRFPSLTNAYDRRSLTWTRTAARLAGVSASRIHSGIYANAGGPAYETRAELRLFRLSGCTVVGMSTVPEVVVAAHAAVGVTAIALVVNHCVYEDEKGLVEKGNSTEGDGSSNSAVLSSTEPTHEEVLFEAEQASADLEALLVALACTIRKAYK